MTELAGRLLVVDWDFFFPNPWMIEKFTEDVLDYDWKHLENPILVEDIWTSRVDGFWDKGRALPRTLPHSGFWERFNIDGDYLVLAGDSNLHAGRLFPQLVDLEAEGWAEVWLFDAHHDSGYETTRSLAQFEERGTMSCEDWMLNHAAQGSRLRVRYPAWRAQADGGIFECEPPPAVEVERAIDDGQPIEGWFDAVYVCRSGAWVPPWCDEDFEDFLAGADGSTEALWIDEDFPRHRTWDEQAARAEYELIKEAKERLRKEQAARA